MQDLPSKEQIIAVVRDEPMVGSQLRRAMGITKHKKLAFKQLLAEMVNEGSLARTSNKEYTPGTGEPKYAEDSEDNRRPSAASRRKATYDDDESRVHRGVLSPDGNDWWQVTDSSTGKVYQMAHRSKVPGKDGETIAFTLYPHPKLKHSMLAKVDRSAMEGDLKWSDVKAQFLKDSSLPEGFSDSIMEFVNKQQAPSEKDLKDGRVDLRNLYILCIDPDGAMDHDDAISVEKRPDGGFHLGVHIADVSHYVPEGSELDDEALTRSFTQYLPWTSVPMLPDRLSSDLCSLHQGVDRLAFSCLIELDKDAHVESFAFKKSMVNITAGITYGEAVKRLEAGDEHVKALQEVTALLRENRRKNGILELGSTEFGCKFDENGEPEKIVPREENESDHWVEECMLIANQCCARELERRHLQGVYRIHEAPDTKDIMELYYQMPDLFKDSPISLRELGKPRRGDTNLNPDIFKLYQHLIARAKGDDEIIMRILRSMQKAHYDSNCFGHFALNWQDYAHFTSPIRRYADLWCHRELSRKTPDETDVKRAWDVVAVCSEISANEVKNQKTERMSLKVCATWLLRKHLGEEFNATVTGVQEWGIYVGVEDPQAEGLVRFRDIAGSDYYVFNPDKGIVYGKRSNKTFARGDKVRVRLLRANPVRGEADFAILEKIGDGRTSKMAKLDRAEAAENLGLVTQPDESELETLRPSERRKVRESYGGDRKANKRKAERDERVEYGRGRKRTSRRSEMDDEPRGRQSRGKKSFGRKKKTSTFGNSRRDSGHIHGKKR
ncbi:MULTISPECIES: RNB domain-containing ribonuclease [Hallerella]|uniref:ribonuclease R family protein n=1 Tax=Hallerella TaxID=2815788 RepID=UPI0025887B3C|nr:MULTISPECIES: RNB domain-containing ribonuclease [Hallerella]MCI6873841.1 RNB domain-containing ribonuclease [Hallerella sp.]MDY5028469.1 RNB domain-containing ribonuclease [Hallerella succinigenes]